MSRGGYLKSPRFKGNIRPFDLKEIYLFYYFIDAGEFSYSNDYDKSPEYEETQMLKHMQFVQCFATILNNATKVMEKH